MSERAELAKIALDAAADDGLYLGIQIAEDIADAILAAGYRKQES